MFRAHAVYSFAMFKISQTKLFTLTLITAFAAANAMAAPTGPSRERAPVAPAEVRHFEQGTEALLAGNMRQAERGLRRALQANADFAPAHNNLAFVLRKRGEDHFAEALRHYNRAIELEPEMAEAFMYRGVLYAAMGELEKALADHARLLELAPDLAVELEWVIQHGREREPAHFFGVVRTL